MIIRSRRGGGGKRRSKRKVVSKYKRPDGLSVVSARRVCFEDGGWGGEKGRQTDR